MLFKHIQEVNDGLQRASHFYLVVITIIIVFFELFVCFKPIMLNAKRVFFPIGLVLIAVLPKRHISKESGLIAPSRYLHIDIRDGGLLVVFVAHDIAKTSIAHKHAHPHKYFGNILLESLLVVMRLMESTE